MKLARHVWAGSLALLLAAGAALATEKPFKPVEGQAGKDAVWVPTPAVLVEKMLDMAGVTPQDYVIDLGSGDGRMVIAAAKRGAQALGVEYNEDLVRLSQGAAEREGVADRAKFVQGDMFAADISKATVMPLFLLPDHFNKLTPKFLALTPGARIVTNGFQIPHWEADATEKAEGDCGAWCTAHLYVVPANAAGTWQLPKGMLRLEQKFQRVSGTFTSGDALTPIADGRLQGSELRFSVAGVEFLGRVAGDRMFGTMASSPKASWEAVRVESAAAR